MLHVSFHRPHVLTLRIPRASGICNTREQDLQKATLDALLVHLVLDAYALLTIAGP